MILNRALIVIYVICLPLTDAYALDQRNAEGYLKRYYSVSEGLSQSEVTSIVRDKYGFIWFGTRGGLNRFDGYDFLHFKPQANQEKGLQNPSIEKIFPDSKGNFWIGTKSGGLSIYDISKSDFVSVKGWGDNLANRIIAFCEDRNGHFWIGTWSNGVYEYDPVNDTLKNYLGQLRVLSIIQTQDGTVWLGTRIGLMHKKPGESEFQLIPMGNSYKEITEMVEIASDSAIWMVGWNVGLMKFRYSDFTFVTHNIDLPRNSSQHTYSILHSGDQFLWVGTWGNGLFRFDLKESTFQPISLLPADIVRKSSDFKIILEIFQDPAGDLWVGTDGGGVVRLSERRNFLTLSAVNSQMHDYWHINSVYAALDGELWIGTRSNGLFISRDKETFESVGFYGKSPGFGMNPSIVNVFHIDSMHQMWVGIDRGIYIVTEEYPGKRCLMEAASFFDSPDLSRALKVNDIKEFNNEIWVATQQQGLFIFEKKEGRYHLKKQFADTDPQKGIQVERVSTIDQDKDGNKWIGTYKGLYRISQNDTIPELVTNLLQDQNSILCDIILCCTIDEIDRIWFGTPCSLNCLVKNSQGKYVLTTYTKEDGLTDDYINAVEFADGHIWATTNTGISRLNPENGEINNYDVSDGVGGYNFSEHASCLSNDGYIYFGGYSDLTFFHPGNISQISKKPEIVITSFKVLNHEVPVRDENDSQVSINEVKKLTFTHKEKEFSFEIAALDFKSPNNNQYAYLLANEDGKGEWVYIGQRRHITFSNLKPGDYTLILAGTNSNGLWNREGRSLEIRVLPPPWQTWYAFIGYLIVIFAIVAMINQVYLKQERLQNLAKIEHINRMQENELNEAKLSFFTDVTHELKTPLTLIQGPIDELRNRDFEHISQPFFSKRIHLIHKNAAKLFEMFNQLMEFRKAEAGVSVLSASKNNIVEFVEDICVAFRDFARHKGIEFKVDIKVREPELWFEPSKMYIIASNLLSNAFKYAGNPGSVSLSLKDSETEVFLDVSNNGEGIGENDLPRIFDRFYQIQGRKHTGGAGIGLYLVKNFVHLHHGQISVESKPGSETHFLVKLLKGYDHLTENEKVDSTETIKQPPARFLPVDSGVAASSHFHGGTKGSKILIVEDNDELRDYLVNLLGDHYEVLEAEDGLAGYYSAIDHLPDLVISDVIMPKSDGYELCSRIKSNDLTSHIPVILLTEKSREQDHLLGVRLGADAYLTKPFTPALLQEKIRQLIAQRILLARKYSKKMIIEPHHIEITSDEGKMINAVISIIEKNIKNPNLDPDFIAGKIGLSNSTFYRRMKKAVNQTPGEFIKSFRLKIAAKYLKETNLTVSEIIENVGYSDIKNFRDIFFSEFGVSPSDYRKSTKS